MTARPSLVCCAAFSALALFGCPNAEAEFGEFQDRYEAIHPDMTGGAGGGSACAAIPKAGELDGYFIFALAASLDPKSPVLFDAQLTTKDGASGLELSMKLQALDTCDRMTKVGETFALGPFAVAADGSFEAKFPPLEVTGLANPFSENPITAETTITGTLCSPADFICGDLAGNVTKPSNISLAKSTFTIERLAMPGVYPAILKVNCAGTTANEKTPAKCKK